MDKPFGGYTSQDNVDGINGFSANTFGLGFGIDAEYKSGNRAGLALFYTNADVDTNDVDQSSDIDVFNLVAYGSNPLFDDKTSLFYQVGLGLQKKQMLQELYQELVLPKLILHLKIYFYN